MVKRTWLILCAFGLTLSSPSYSQQDKAKQELPKRPNISQTLTADPTAVAKPETTIPDRGCKRGYENRQSDLCAQWKAADAAADSATWTFWTLITGIVGLFLGSGTLFAAWRAAHWAKRAAEETGKGATAAETALDESRQQMRPYVAFTNADDDQTGPFSRATAIRLKIKNFGNIPAQNVTLAIGGNLCIEPIGEYIVELPSEKRGNYGFLAPSDERSEKIYVDSNGFTIDDFGEIAKGRYKLLVRARVEYTWAGGSDFHDITLILHDPISNNWQILDEYRRNKKR